MARKPARLERAGALTPRDRMWAAMRALQLTPACAWSPIEIWLYANRLLPKGARAADDMHVDSVTTYLEGLCAAQPPYVERLASRAHFGEDLQHYRLVRDVGVEAPRVNRHGKPVTQGLGNELLWGAMKVLREFDYVELVAAVAESAAKAGVEVSWETAKTYCMRLERAGYLGVSVPAVSGHVKARYRFNRAMNTGPRAPLLTAAREVIDGNTGAVAYPKGDKA